MAFWKLRCHVENVAALTLMDGLSKCGLATNVEDAIDGKRTVGCHMHGLSVDITVDPDIEQSKYTPNYVTAWIRERSRSMPDDSKKFVTLLKDVVLHAEVCHYP